MQCRYRGNPRGNGSGHHLTSLHAVGGVHPGATARRLFPRPSGGDGAETNPPAGTAWSNKWKRCEGRLVYKIYPSALRGRVFNE